MSQAYEEREGYIQLLIPELIQQLTGFDETEENFTLCHQFAVATVRNHRFLSVNSHEIRRRADGLMQNLRISNLERVADQFRGLFEAFVVEPACADHYVHDIQWSVLLFLMTVAHNPVGALKERVRRGSPVAMLEVGSGSEVDSVEDDERRELVEELREDDIEVGGAREVEDDSELSEWTDSEGEEEGEGEQVVPEVVEETSKVEAKEVVIYTRVESPKRDLGYESFDASGSEDWLKENVQSNWWQNPKAKAEVNSSHEGASFCDYWSQTILKASHSFIKPDPVSTVSEYCLIREILWMFTNPANCKFFRIDDDQVWINPNVSLSSTTERGLHTFLLNFTEHMTIVYRLRNFCQKVANTSSKPIPAPYSFECYASGVRDFLKNLETTVVDLEKQAIAQQPDRIFTIITLFHDLEPQFQLLKNLNDIHRYSVLDWTKFPAHIAVAHLLSGLFRSVKLSGNLAKSNLAFSLLLSTLKGYMNIIDMWWTEGRLDDWREEFLVEKTYSEADGTSVTGYRARLFSKCKKRSFYVSAAISEVIETDAIIQLLMHHSLEAGYTLNILSCLDRISDLRSGCAWEEGMLYVGFLEAIVDVLEGFRTVEEKSEAVAALEGAEEARLQVEKFAKDTVSASKLQNLRNQIREICDDELLMMALDSSLQACADDDDDGEEACQLPSAPSPSCLTNAHSLYTRLNSISGQLMLPLEHVLFGAIKNLMETKRQAANHFVTTIYKEEFLVLHHLKNVRKVLLLEASDLMYYFYNDLFRRIEAGESWANPYLLTIQLNDILASRFNDMTSLFTIEIVPEHKAETTTVLDAIDKLRILYDPGNDLSNMINEEAMASYNCLFRFLLKVKWALCTLESLRFPECYKRRPPYEEPCVLDLNLKRLSMLKFWMIFSVQCIHSHLMTHVLQSLGMQLDERLEAADNLNEMIAVHRSYIGTIYDHSFQTDDSKPFREGVIRLLNLVHIVRDEWNSNVLYVEMDARGDIEDNSMIGDFIANAQVGMLETTYCKCHQQLAELLNREVYAKRKMHLAALADAFSYNVPY